MPNWCENFITIHNPKVFKEKCIKDGKFLFSNIIPMPAHMKLYNELNMCESEEKHLTDNNITLERIGEELENLFFRGGVIDYLYAKKWMDKEEERTGEKSSGWYDWDCNNFGTKWDLDGGDVNIKDLEEAIRTDSDYYFQFDTAWSPPEPVLEKMAELGVEFDWECEEGGSCIYMEGQSDGKCFSCWDKEPPEEEE